MAIAHSWHTNGLIYPFSCSIIHMFWRNDGVYLSAVKGSLFCPPCWTIAKHTITVFIPNCRHAVSKICAICMIIRLIVTRGTDANVQGHSSRRWELVLEFDFHGLEYNRVCFAFFCFFGGQSEKNPFSEIMILKVEELFFTLWLTIAMSANNK